jgi:hypothetical protein
LFHEIRMDMGYQGLSNGLVWDRLPGWSAEQRLDAWAELNWRMERALLPLPPSWVSRIEAVLAEIAPFAELPSTAKNFFGPDAHRFQERADLRKPWVELALGVLRHHREFRHATEFRAWLERLAPLDAHWDEVHHQRCHQEALWHLTFLADDQALAVIERWDGTRGRDPYWLARKGGLVAELGKLADARALWDDCLQRLQGFTSDTAPFFATSRQSAVLHLSRVAAWEHRATREREIADRLRSLSSIDGWDYWSELASLSKPDFEAREKRAQIKSGEVVNFGPSLWEPAEAVQCFRFCEELGEPLIIQDGYGRMISAFVAAFRDIFGDLASASEELAGTLLMRLRYDDFWQKQLSHAQVARLPDGLLADMLTACSNGWRMLESELDGDGVDRTARIISGLIRVLRWRLEPEMRKDVFKRLLELGDREAVCSRRFAARALKEAIEELAEDFDRREVTQVIPEALAFPLPGEVGADEHFWPHPMGLKVPDPKGAPLPQAVTTRIMQLVERAPEDREALLNLAFLNVAQLLPPEAARTLAIKLWPNNGALPNIAPLLPNLLLDLPDLGNNQAEDALAKHFIETPPSNFRDAQGTISFGGEEWFRDLHHVSRPYRRPGARFVAWSSQQADILLKYADAWWKEDGKLLIQTRDKHLLSSGVYRRMYWLRFCLARAIAPALQPSSDAGGTRLPSLVKDIESQGYSMLSVHPLLLRFKIGDANSTADQLIEGLRSKDSETVSDALWGVIHWCEFKKDAKLPAIPHRLIEQLLIFLAARAEGKNAAEAVGTLEAILDHDPSILSTRARELLELALDGLQVRAEYPETWYQHERQRHAQLVVMRKNAVLLASAAYNAGISNHDAVLYWLSVGRNDPLPIVRQGMKSPPGA